MGDVQINAIPKPCVDCGKKPVIVFSNLDGKARCGPCHARAWHAANRAKMP